jgi:hypothetical protein
MEYVQARVQARYGERPDEPLWRELAGTKEIAPALETAHRSRLRRWVAGVDASSDAHEVELRLRARLRDAIEEVATWMPAEWRPATRWTVRLVDLPALLHLARGAPPLAWMAHDPPLAAYAGADEETRIEAIRRGPLAFLEPVWDRLRAPVLGPGLREHRSAALAAWREEWRRRWPPQDEESAAGLEHLADTIATHAERFVGTPPAESARARRALAQRLERMFRRNAALPAAVFAYLALVALDLERLRAELGRRTALRAAGVAP